MKPSEENTATWMEVGEDVATHRGKDPAFRAGSCLRGGGSCACVQVVEMGASQIEPQSKPGEVKVSKGRSQP